MQKNVILNKCKEVENLLVSYDIASSINILLDIAREVQDYNLVDELNRLRDTYRYMASYMIDGIADLSRKEVYQDILENLRSITDNLRRHIHAKDS